MPWQRSPERSTGASNRVDLTDSPDLTMLVEQAARFAADVAPPGADGSASAPEVFSRHLSALALATAALPPSVARALGADDDDLRAALISAVMERWPQEDIAGWTALLARPPSEAVAGFHHDDTRHRDLLAEDSLDIEPHVRALALLMTSKVLKPPLAVGLFGDWGSGKTYFMRALRQEVDRLTTQARRSGLRQHELPVYRNVAQIEFNAWHFVDTDLWASLADYIFANLRITEGEQEHNVSKRRKLYVDKLSEQGAAIRQIETERAHLQARIELSETELEQVRAQARSQLGIEAHTRAAVKASTGLRNEVGELATRLGLPQVGDSVADLEDALARAREVATGARTSLDVLSGRFGTRWALVAVATLLVGPIVLWLTTYADVNIVQQAAATIAGVIGSIAAWIRTGSAAASSTLATINRLDSNLEHEVERDPTVGSHRRALEVLREEERQLMDEEARLRKDLTKVEQSLRELSPATLLADFILSRNDSDDYRKHLGLASLIRRDFEALAEHIDEFNSSLESDDALGEDEVDADPASPSEAEYHVNRIVLYIDDLDRCPPETVAKVLQAVHLLLAFPLFVVVVGVDARWLSRSLTKHYEGLLGSREPDVTGGNATPQDYLEKIFQIPFWLRPMPLDATGRLLDALTETRHSSGASDSADTEPGRDGDREQTSLSVGGTRDQALPESSLVGLGSGDDDDRQTATSMARAHSERAEGERPVAAATPAYDLRISSTDITQAERDFMQDLRPMLGRSPRSLTRYVNVFRLLKAVDRHTNRGQRPASDPDEVTMFLLAVLTGYPEVAQPLLTEMVQPRRDDDDGSLSAAVKRARRGARETGEPARIQWDQFGQWLADHQDWVGAQQVGSWGPTAQRVARYSYRFDATAPSREE